MKIPCTGIILSGGENKRFGRQNKAFAKIGTVRILDLIYRTFSLIFDNIIIVTNNPIDYLDFDCCIVTDHYIVKSSLNGIYAGLFISPTKHSFVMACDTPFVTRDLVEFILAEIELSKDIIVPETSMGFEPLCAVYSKNCLKIIERQLNRGELQILKIFDKLRVKKLTEASLKKKDSNLLSFFNVNNHADLTAANTHFKKANNSFIAKT